MCQVRVFNGSDDQFIGPLFHVNYFSLMDCNWYPRFVFAFLVVVLILFLKSTADEFLSGALTVICEILELSQDVAGATFLAFGNGAPDVFSTLAAFTKGTGAVNADLGLGSLLGGASFVTTVVLGAVIIGTKEDIPVFFETFGRDVIFLIIALIFLAGLHLYGGGASIGIGITFLCLYGLYVCLVIYQSRVFRKQKCWNDDPEADEPLISFVHIQPSSPADTSNGSQAMLLPLVITDDYFEQFNRAEMRESMPTDLAKPVNVSSCSKFAVFQDVYWRQLRLRQRAIRFGAKAASNLSELSLFFRIVAVIQMPLGFLRALTVPLPEPSSWSKNIVVLHPPLCTAFFLFVLFQGYDTLGLLLTIFVPISALVSIFLFFSVHDSQPPKSRPAKLMFALVSFSMCVIWIFAVASEIVALFNSFGAVFGANSSVMGLSFLAWGNSVGDLVTNVAVARSGMPAMGVSACVASPVFNILFGLGASLTVVAAKQYPLNVPVTLDIYTVAALGLLLTMLCLTLALARYRDFKLNRGIGIILVGSYFVYLGVIGIMTVSQL
jgi:sodium/potassium/calcium exchanger 6